MVYVVLHAAKAFSSSRRIQVCCTLLLNRKQSLPLRMPETGQLTGGARKLALDTGLPLLGRLPFDTKLGRAAERGVALAEVLVRSSDSSNLWAVVNRAIERSYKKQLLRQVQQQGVTTKKQGVDSGDDSDSAGPASAVPTPTN